MVDHRWTLSDISSSYDCYIEGGWSFQPTMVHYIVAREHYCRGTLFSMAVFTTTQSSCRLIHALSPFGPNFWMTRIDWGNIWIVTATSMIIRGDIDWWSRMFHITLWNPDVFMCFDTHKCQAVDVMWIKPTLFFNFLTWCCLSRYLRLFSNPEELWSLH